MELFTVLCPYSKIAAEENDHIPQQLQSSQSLRSLDGSSPFSFGLTSTSELHILQVLCEGLAAELLWPCHYSSRRSRLTVRLGKHGPIMYYLHSFVPFVPFLPTDVKSNKNLLMEPFRWTSLEYLKLNTIGLDFRCLFKHLRTLELSYGSSWRRN